MIDNFIPKEDYIVGPHGKIYVAEGRLIANELNTLADHSSIGDTGDDVLSNSTLNLMRTGLETIETNGNILSYVLEGSSRDAIPGEIIKFMPDVTNVSNSMFSMNGNQELPIFYNGVPLIEGYLHPGSIYYIKKSDDGTRYDLLSTSTPSLDSLSPDTPLTLNSGLISGSSGFGAGILSPGTTNTLDSNQDYDSITIKYPVGFDGSRVITYINITDSTGMNITFAYFNNLTQIFDKVSLTTFDSKYRVSVTRNETLIDNKANFMFEILSFGGGSWNPYTLSGALIRIEMTVVGSTSPSMFKEGWEIIPGVVPQSGTNLYTTTTAGDMNLINGIPVNEIIGNVPLDTTVDINTTDKPIVYTERTVDGVTSTYIIKTFTMSDGTKIQYSYNMDFSNPIKEYRMISNTGVPTEWATVRGGEIDEIRGGVSDDYNTLKKIYDAIQSLNTTVNNEISLLSSYHVYPGNAGYEFLVKDPLPHVMTYAIPKASGDSRFMAAGDTIPSTGDIIDFIPEDARHIYEEVPDDYDFSNFNSYIKRFVYGKGNNYPTPSDYYFVMTFSTMTDTDSVLFHVAMKASSSVPDTGSMFIAMRVGSQASSTMTPWRQIDNTERELLTGASTMSTIKEGDYILNSKNDVYRLVYAHSKLLWANVSQPLRDRYKEVLGRGYRRLITKRRNDVHGDFSASTALDTIVNRPVETGLPYHQDYEFICDDDHVFAFHRSSNTLYGLGWNHYGSLGLGHNDEVTVFTFIADDIREIWSYEGQTFIVDTLGVLKACGWNYYGQLGIGSTDDANVFTECILPNSNERILDVYIATTSTFVLVDRWGTYSNQNELLATGRNTAGELGDGTTDNKNSFIVIDQNIAKVSVDYGCTMVSYLDGTVKATGSNYYGNLGVGDTSNRSSLTSVDTGGRRITNIYCTSRASFLETREGEVLATGYNSSGRLGIGDTTNRSTPTVIAGFKDGFLKVRTGYSDAVYILSRNGKLYTAGLNTARVLGAGDIGDHIYILTEVKGLPKGYKITSFAVDTTRPTVVLSDGTAWGVDYNIGMFIQLDNPLIEGAL